MDKNLQIPYKNATIEAITKLTEKKLQSGIVEPLLRNMGFTHVRDNSGRYEHGKDLVAIKTEWGKPKLYAIQIKKIKFTAKHAGNNALNSIVSQLRQTMLEPVIDPLTNLRRKPDRGVFITPYAMTSEILESAIAQVRELEHRDITIIEGSNLVDQVLIYIPEAVMHASSELQYRMHLVRSIEKIPESSAFGLKENLSLSNIYVNLSMTYGISSLFALSNIEANNEMKLLPLYKDELELLKTCLTKRIREKIEELKSWRRRRHNVLIIKFNIKPLLDAINNKVEFFKLRVSNFLKLNQSKQELNLIVNDSVRYITNISPLLEITVLHRIWPFLNPVYHSRKYLNNIPTIPSNYLHEIEKPVLVVGEPGAGKTTLLRRICKKVAESSSSTIPIFIHLVRLREASEESLILECIEQLASYGNEITKESFLKDIDQGKYHILLDGLDESGSFVVKLYNVIQIFSKHYPKCKIIVSCRDTLDLSVWKNALNVTLRKFTDSQLNDFINNWFQAEPTNCDKLKKWLKDNIRMKNSARTPVIAALLCSLQQAQSDMPTTEVELYEKRFYLLLGKWEQAKDIPPLPRHLQEHFLHLLMEFAHNMHKKESREEDFNELSNMYNRLYRGGPKENITIPLIDLIHRGILFKEPTGKLSFGHLTYQEFLVGRWLAANNPIPYIWRKLSDPWWKKSLEFYAGIKQDLTGLVKFGLSRSDSSIKIDILKSLVSFAQLTSPRLL